MVVEEEGGASILSFVLGEIWQWSARAPILVRLDVGQVCL